ncbi:MAG: hypothetical protein WBF53_00120 [Litorimonas sp.]
MRLHGLTLVILLAGCAESPVVGAAEAVSEDTPSASTREASSQTNTVTQDVPERHARIIDLLEAGDRAAQARDAAGLFEASDALTQLGASPIGGADDLARLWEIDALDLTPEGSRESIPFRGRVKGPAYRRQTLAPGERDVIEDIFYAAEPAEMTLKSSQGAALRWEIAEDGPEADAPVCAVEPVGAEPRNCRFLPLWTAKYRIVISNVSDQDSTYLFVTN